MKNYSAKVHAGAPQALGYWLLRMRWSILKFADTMGVTEQGALNWIEGKCLPNATNRAKIKEITGIEWEVEATGKDDAGSFKHDAIAASIEGLVRDVSAVKAEVAGIDAKVDGIKAEVDGVNEAMQALASAVATLVFWAGRNVHKAMSMTEVPENLRTALDMLGEEIAAAEQNGGKGGNGSNGAGS